MKTRGKYLLGIDFGKGEGEPLVYVVPVDKRGTPNFLQAESLSFDQFEKIADELKTRTDGSKSAK